MRDTLKVICGDCCCSHMRHVSHRTSLERLVCKEVTTGWEGLQAAASLPACRLWQLYVTPRQFQRPTGQTMRGLMCGF